MNALKLCVLFSLLALAGCPPTPAPPVPDADAAPTPSDAPAPAADAPPVSAIQAACANLQAAGCASGSPNCASALQRALDERISKLITPDAIQCVATAGQLRDAIRKCGNGWCP
jgi:hypothetical protein